MLKNRDTGRQHGGKENPFTPDELIPAEAFSITGIYCEGNYVVIECKDLPRVEITWREAISRAQGLSSALGRNRDRRDQQLIEDVIAAAREARKADEAGWTPPPSVSMFMGKTRLPMVSGPMGQTKPGFKEI